MGDARFLPHYERLRKASDRQAEIDRLEDDEIVQALGAASRRRDPLLANVLTTEAMNRMRRAVAIARHLGEGVLAADAEGRCTFVNASAAQFFGEVPQALLGRDIRDITRLRTREGGHVPLDPASNVLASGKTERSAEHAFRAADGRVIPIAYTFAPILEEDRPVGVIVTFRDISQLIRQEEGLARANEFLQAALDALPVSIAVLDEEARIVSVNAEWRAFGRENELAWDDGGIGRSYSAACDVRAGPDADDASRFAEALQRVIDGTMPFFELEYPCHSPTNKRWFLGRITPFTWDGPRHVLVSHMDITLRKLAELEAGTLARTVREP